MKFIIELLGILYEYKIKFRESTNKINITNEFIQNIENLKEKKYI